MFLFYAIAAMSENRVIGDQGKIPWHIPEDFRWFKHKTMGGTLIMGRKTFESMGKPLPGRTTVVFTHGSREPVGGEIYCDEVKLDATLDRLPQPYWICGGAEIYRRFVPVSQVVYLTVVKRKVDGDTFLPPFEEAFERNQVIYENQEFRVERWLSKKLPDGVNYPAEEWPFPKAK